MTDLSQRQFTTPEGLILVGDVAGPPNGPAVVLLHGGGQTRHSWTGAMRRLVERGYFVVNYDARGHGDSDWSPVGDYSLPALASDLCAVLSTIDVPTALVGASMGGMTSFYAIGSADRRIADALVMVDIVLRPAAAGAEKIRSFMTSHRNGFKDLAEAADAVTAYNPDRPRPSDPAGLMKNLRLREDGRLHWHWDPRLMDARPSAEPPSFANELETVSRHVTIPTLLVRGGHSDIVDDEGVAAMCRLVPQTEVFEVPGAGHMVAGDRNDAFNDGVLAFLDRHLPTR
ncbi:alpha/beta fold hydrolase [Sphingomonas oryzagri]